MSKDKRTTHKRVLVLGLDGASFTLLLPWIKEGHLPNLKSIMDTGVWGPMRSTIPPYSPVAWTSLSTGVNPGKHNVFGFLDVENDRLGLNKKPISSYTVKSSRVWDLLKDKKSAIINLLVTYPPRKLNGYMISGWYSPEPASYPPDFIRKEKFIAPVFETSGLSPKKIYCESLKILSNRRAMIFKMFKKYDVDFCMAIIVCTEIIQHMFWKKKNLILSFYKHVDSFLGEIKAFCDKNGINLLIVSDHGYGKEIETCFMLNTWLHQSGLLPMKDVNFMRKVKARLLNILILLANRCHMRSPKTMNKKKHVSKCKVKGPSFDFARSNVGCPTYAPIPEGLVIKKPSADLVNKLMSKLKKTRHMGRKIVKECYMKKEIYSGPYVKNACDIIFTTEERITTKGQFYPYIFKSVFKGYTHKDHGIFIAYGGAIKNYKTLKNTHIYDVVPTVLKLFDKEVPSYLDGRVLI